MIGKVKALAIVGAAAAVATFAAPAAPAQAAAYNGVCGSGYGVIDSFSLPGKGTVYLTYNRNTGKNCAVTIANQVGPKRHMYVYLGLGDESKSVTDNDDYTIYAGPVYLAAAGKCIDWYGGIQNVNGGFEDEHCG